MLLVIILDLVEDPEQLSPVKDMNIQPAHVSTSWFYRR